MIYLIAEVESDPTNSGKHFNFSRVVMFHEAAARTL